MSASLTIHTDRFPAGAFVAAYAASEEVRVRGDQTPGSRPLATALVQADGEVEFDGLPADTSLWLHAFVAGQHRWVLTETGDDDGEAADDSFFAGLDATSAGVAFVAPGSVR